MRIPRASIALLGALTVLAGACSSDSKTSTSASSSTASSGTAASGSATSLKGVCPDNIVIQTDWYATPERAAAYQLVGPNGKIDATKGTYSGPLGDTGVNVEVRLGGPFIGYQPASAQMYQDDSIYLGYVPTDEAVQNQEKLPTTSVVAPLDINPQILMWDPATYTINGWSDVAATKAKILYIEGLPFMDYLVSKGYVTKDQLDASFDGTPSRFVADAGKSIQQGYASNEPYRWEHDVEGWKKPVKSLLISDSGYEIYPQGLAVKTADLAKSDSACLKKLVPMIQQAQVDYMKDPTATNGALVKIADAIKDGPPITAPANADAVKVMLADKLIGNGPNATLGDVDMDRIDRTIALLLPIFEGARRQRALGEARRRRHRHERVHRPLHPPVNPPTVVGPSDLIKAGANLVATVDDDRTEIAGGWVAVTDGVIVGVGAPGDEPVAQRRIDASGCLVTPGLVNAHTHLWQNLTRAFRPMTTTDFLGWLGTLYPLWSQIDVDGIYLSTRIGLAELALGGCTTTSDHLYLQPPDQPSFLDAEIDAARQSGLRFHATRGSVDRGQRDGSPMPDHMLESVDAVLADCERLVGAHHERGPRAMVQVALGPHSVFGATSELMREVAVLAERLDVRLHTHLSGDLADDGYCLDLHGCRPVEWLESLGWASPRTWVAHCFFPDDDEIARLGAAHVGVAHCATAGLLMGVGVAPIPELCAAGVPVGLGVDGSSNSDAGSMWLEARMAMIANRFRAGPEAFGARDALVLATRGGAACLGREGEIGVLAPGANADVALWPIEGLQWAGAVSDPIDAWLRCGPTAPTHVLVGGQPVVEDGHLLQPDLDDLLSRHAAAARRLQGC